MAKENASVAGINTTSSSEKEVVTGEESEQQMDNAGASIAASDAKPEYQQQTKGGEQKNEGEEDEEEDFEFEKGFRMKRICDRLVEVFWIEKKTPDEWRKLLAFSSEWSRIRPHFFKRCRARAKEMEDPGKRAELFRLARRLKEVDESMQRHDELFKFIEENEDAVEGIVARRRKDFTGEFFDHIALLCSANYDNPNRQQEIAQLGAKCLTAVEMHDKLMEDQETVDIAQKKFEDILNSPSLDAACKKIDDLTRRQELDPTLMLMITKAWAAAKESNMMKDEVKDILYHLYMNSRANMQLRVPKEVRIIRHILSLDDPRERFAALTSAFTPGEEKEFENAEIDILYTTPEKLLKWIEAVLKAYYNNQATTLIDEARRLLQPNVIKRLEVIKDIIIDEFM